MRNTLLISLLGIFLISCAPSQNESGATTQDESGAATIKKFYHYYIIETEKTFPQIKFNDDTLRKYCTASFLRKWHDTSEYDRVLQAQDEYVEWAKNSIVVPLNNTENNEYNVCFLGPINHCIIVTVKKEQGNYKISDTRGIY